MSSQRTPVSFRPIAHHLWSALADLAWPVHCAACATPGASLCSNCFRALTESPGFGIRTAPIRDGTPVTSIAEFEDPLRTLISAFKDRGRTDVRWLLARLLTASVRAAVHTSVSPMRGAGARASPWLVVPIPSAPDALKERGRFPLAELLNGLGGLPVRCANVLETTRTVADQSGLDRAQRAANVAGAFRVRRSPRARDHPQGCHVIVVDDVLTTGATLREGVRAVQAAGAESVVGAVIARTRSPSTPRTKRVET